MSTCPCCALTRAVNLVLSMICDCRVVYRCKVAAAGAGLTSTSVLFPSLSWKTSSESVQTYTGKSKGMDVDPSLEFKVFIF